MIQWNHKHRSVIITYHTTEVHSCGCFSILPSYSILCETPIAGKVKTQTNAQVFDNALIITVYCNYMFKSNHYL